MLLGTNPSQTDTDNQENPPETSYFDPPPPLTSRSVNTLESERLLGESSANDNKLRTTNSCTSTNPPPSINPETPKGAIQSSLDKDREKVILRKLFRDDHLHQHNHCGINPSCQVAYPVKSTTDKMSKFQHSTLSRPEAYNKETGTWWLVFKENEGMFCLLCKKHDTRNENNRKKIFNEIPAVRCKPESVRVHADSPQHKLTIQLELLQRGSQFQHEIHDKEKRREIEYMKIFELVYWLAKEELPNKKLTSVLNMIKHVTGVDLKRQFPYTSKEIERELF